MKSIIIGILIPTVGVCKIIIKDVNLVDLNEGKIRKVNIWITKERIEKITQEKLKNPREYFIINGKEKYVLPGFVDMCTFLTRSAGGNVSVEEFSFAQQKKELLSLLRCGVTTILDISSPHEFLEEIKKEMKKDNLPTPTILSSSALLYFEKNTQLSFYKLENWNPEVIHSIYIDKISKAKLFIDSIITTGIKFVPLICPKNNEKIKLVQEVINLCKSKGLKTIMFVFHSNSISFQNVDAFVGKNLTEGGQISCLSVYNYPRKYIRGDKLYFLSVPQVIEITQQLPYSFTKKTFTKENWNIVSPDLSGNKILVGTGAGNPLIFPGISLLDEIIFLKEEGIENLEILRGLTIYAQKFLELKDREGIKVGEKADLVILESNPLQDIKGIKEVYLVIKNGELVSKPLCEYLIKYTSPSPLSFGKPRVVDDFEDKDTISLWSTPLVDEILQYGYKGKLSIINEGYNSQASLTIRGELGNNFWESMYKGNFIPLEKELYQGINVTQYDGISLDIKGDNKEYFIYFPAITIKDYRYPGTNIVAKNEWQTIKIDFSSIGGNVSLFQSVRGIGIAPYTQGKGEYEICIDNICFYSKDEKEVYKRVLESIIKLLDLGVCLWYLPWLEEACGGLVQLYEVTRDTLVGYYLGYSLWRLAQYYYDKNNNEKYIEEGIKVLEEISNESNFQEVLSLLYSFYGLKMGKRPYLAMFLSTKANKVLKKAEKMEENPRLYLIKGISKLFTPPMFGGGIDKAITNFKKAIPMFEEDNNKINWGKEDALCWLGIAYYKKKEFKKAKKVFKEALKLNPHYSYAWFNLLKL